MPFNTYSRHTGLSVGLCRLCVQPFVCEFSTPHVRSITGSFWMVFYTTGFALAVLFGLSVVYQTVFL